MHPQSIIHSMVEFVDDSIKMQASLPSMHLPIQDALSYPDRLDRAGTALAHPLRWPEVAQLDFEEVDMERFPCLRLAYEAGRAGGTAPAVLVGADETGGGALPAAAHPASADRQASSRTCWRGIPSSPSRARRPCWRPHLGAGRSAALRSRRNDHWAWRRISSTTALAR